eukprot:gene16223-biopygen84420
MIRQPVPAAPVPGRRRAVQSPQLPCPADDGPCSPRSSRARQAAEDEGLLQEVELLSALSHDNIVQYCGSAVAGRHIVIVMEYVSGGSLQVILEQFAGRLPRASVQRYVRDIREGSLHGNGGFL